MIDPTTLAVISALETFGEKAIVLFLVLSAEPVPKSNIARLLKADRFHCSTLLKKLSENGIVAEFEKFGTTYCMPVLSAIPQAKPARAFL